MRPFLFKILLFLLPFLAVLAWGEGYLFSQKETIPVKRVVEIQSESRDEIYYQRIFFDNNLALYKLAGINQKKPEILVLGQSIVLQIRDFMFHPLEEKFYNAGHLISNVDELERVIKMMRDGDLHQPKVIIFGLDGGLPKAKFWLDWKRSFDAEYDDPVHDPNAHARALQKYFKGLIAGGGADEIPTRQAELGIGFMGQRGYGYRRDGSALMGKEVTDFLKNPAVFEDRKKLNEIYNNRQMPFNLPFHFDPEKTERIKKCLNDFREMGIEVVVLAAPYADHFLSNCLADTTFAVFWRDFNRLKKEVEEEMHFPFFKLEIPEQIGLDDRFMLDCNHPGEVLMAMLLVRFFRQHPDKLGYLSQVDISYLESKLRDPKTIPLSFREEHPLILETYAKIPADQTVLKEAMKKVLLALDGNFVLD